MTDAEKSTLRKGTSEPSWIFRLVVPTAILAITVITVIVMVKTRPKPTPKKRGERAYIVTLAELAPSTEQVMVRSAGTVVPSSEITLYPRVSGQIILTDGRFIPGGAFKKDEVILQLDPLDYETALANSRAALARAHSALVAEEGLQSVARHEWSELKAMDEGKKFTDLEESLALRKPNLLVAEEGLKAAEAQVIKARADLNRTSVTAPFNCTVRTRYVDVGSQVSAQTPVAVLSGTDSVWIRTTMPVSALKWVEPAAASGKKGSQVSVTPVPGVDLDGEWEGAVLRIAPDLEPEGRQAQLIIEVPSPKAPVKGSGNLLIGSYVRVAIAGATVKDVFKIPSAALHSGSHVWLMREDSRLEVRSVDVVWQGAEYSYLGGGVSEGEMLVVSDLATPTKGMLLQDVARPLQAGGKMQQDGKKQSK